MDKMELELAGCLRRLFRNRYILRSQNEAWFKSIVDNRKRIQEVIQTLGANLEINEPLGVTYIRPGNEETEERLGLKMTRSRVLGVMSTALILRLRWHRLQFYLRPTGDDVPIVGIAEMREHLQQFNPSKIDLHFEKQFRRAIEELAELQVLIETSRDSGYYEITALCDLLLPADQIRDLKERAELYFKKARDADGEMKESEDVG